MRGKRLEVAQRLPEHPLHDRQVHLEIAVHQNVAEPGDRAQPRRKLRGEYRELREPVDRSRVVRRIEPGRGRDMRRDIESILYAELKPSLDRSAQLSASPQLSRGSS